MYWCFAFRDHFGPIHLFGLDIKLIWVCLHLRLRSRRWLIVSSLSVPLFLGVYASRFGHGSGSAACFQKSSCRSGGFESVGCLEFVGMMNSLISIIFTSLSNKVVGWFLSYELLVSSFPFG
ncbi:hypothetical protein QL285_009458 [Trifolium repens]|nr:hypothetical protein QL285_008390 [Trifolium repens]KAK2450335.1 hypothetical protein QL285_009458 [Trifolium repens]